LPYIRDSDFVKLAEVLNLAGGIARRENVSSLIELTGRALAILRPYLSEEESADVEKKTKRKEEEKSR